MQMGKHANVCGDGTRTEPINADGRFNHLGLLGGHSHMFHTSPIEKYAMPTSKIERTGTTNKKEAFQSSHERRGQGNGSIRLRPRHIARRHDPSRGG